MLGALMTNLRSAGWKVKRATFLMTKRRTRCILGLDLQGQVGIATTQKPAPKDLSRFDVLMCEQSEGWKNKIFNKFSDFFVRQGISKNHIVSSNCTRCARFKKKREESQSKHKIRWRKKMKKC